MTYGKLQMTMGAPELRINLGSLKRQDPYIDRIIDSSTHVAIYSFSPQRNEWEKTEVEGTLFVYKRVAPPYWGFTIMNRLSMENLTEPLASELEFQTQNPFLLYRNAKLLIYGIWFYDQEDCKRIGGLLQRLCNEGDKPSPEIQNLLSTKLFAGGDADFVLKGSAMKSSSPASNSANSISPGSSVGAPLQQTSNGEPDSECDEKEILKSKDNHSVDILDLLSKAQDKFEKEKRNTPDPVTDTLKSSSITIPGGPGNHIVKPIPLKPVNQQKLDVAALFKQHPPGSTNSFTLHQNHTNNGTGTFHVTGVNDPFHGGTKVMGAMPPGMTAVISPRNTVARKLGRSQSMTEVTMGKHLDLRMGGSVLSVEEVEKGLGKIVTPMVTANERQQQLNSTLDKMIDRINSGQALSTADNPTRVSTLPVLSEVVMPVANANTVPGLASSGSTVIVANQVKYPESDVFSSTSTQTSAGYTSRSFQQLLPKARSSVQRSMSSSALSNTDTFPKPTSLSAGLQFKTNFPIPQMPNTATVQARKDGTDFILASSSASLHASGMISNEIDSPADRVQSVPTAVSVTNTGKASKPKVSKVPIVPKVSNGSTPTTLISPEDFERSAATPQKTLELKQRLLEAPKAGLIGSSVPIPDPLTKSQLRNALIVLLQKDDTFLSAIHDVYLTNFEHLSS